MLGWNQSKLYKPGFKHWKEVLENPRRPIIKWHVLQVGLWSLHTLHSHLIWLGFRDTFNTLILFSWNIQDAEPEEEEEKDKDKKKDKDKDKDKKDKDKDKDKKDKDKDKKDDKKKDEKKDEKKK